MNNLINNDVDSSVTGSRSWSFIAFMLALTLLFVFLGNWQLNLLGQKQATLAAIEERIQNAPIELPPIAEWVGFDPKTYNYRPLTVRGKFDHSKTVRVFTSLMGAKGIYSGPGYWILAPLMLNNGGILFVNRGFVPQAQMARFEDGGAGPLHEVTIVGIGRLPEEVNSFTPGTDFENRIDRVRNIERLSQFLDANAKNVLPIFLDAEAGEAGALPQGGETRQTVINWHLEFALIWYLLALAMPILLFFWWRRTGVKPPS